MEGSPEAFGSSMAPLAWHDFLERMRHPSAADFVKSIKSFIVSFSNRAPDPEKDSAAVQQFLATMEEAFKAHMLWATSSEEDLESAGEGLEKYVMTKLYNRAFAALPEDVKRDEELSRKVALVQQFICPENLDIKPAYQNETSWLLAQKELQKINMYKAPRDKLVCILNCSKVINNLLLHASISSNDNPPGADEFLPVLIYVTIKANPPQLHSNLLYIQRYRCQSRLVSEAAYFFTNILSAESFIWNLDAQSLSMDEAKFQMKMDSARVHLLGLSNSAERQRNQTNQEDCRIEAPRPRRDTGPPQEHEQNKDLDAKPQQISKSPSISELEKKGAADLLKDDQPSKFFQDFPFLFAQAGDLTVDDVESLLSSYKQLVLKYVSLSKGMDSSSISLPAISIEVPESSETSKETSDAIDMEMQLESEGLVGKEKNEISREPENALDMVMKKFKSEGLSIKDDSLDNLLSNADEADSKINVDDSVSHISTEKDEQFN